jgi:hypothetical protein
MPRSQAAVTANLGSAPFFAGKNKIINGDFTVNQRNFTSASNTSGYKFDRWGVSAFNSGTITDSAQTFTPGSAPVEGYEGSTYYRVVTDGSAGVSNYYALLQKVENVRTFANQTTVLSFWARAASGTPKIAIEIEQNFGSGGSPSSSVQTAIGQITLSTSWTRYSVAISVPSIAGKTIGTTANTSCLTLLFWFTAGSNYNSRTGSLGIQANTFDLWGVQWEAGTVATPFQTATGTIQGELAACQRYYFRMTAANVYTRYGTGCFESTTRMAAGIPLPVRMRVAPTSMDSSNIATWDFGTVRAATSLSLDSNTSPDMAQVVVDIASGATQYRPAQILANNTTSSYLGFSAEL